MAKDCVLLHQTLLKNCILRQHPPHVETVCVLVNKNRKPDDYLRVEIDADKIHEILDKEKAEREAKEYGEKSDEVVA